MSQSPDPEPERPPPEGISLDELTEAFAQALGIERSAAAEPPVSSGTPGAEDAIGAPDELLAGQPGGVEPEMLADRDDPCEISPRSILEAMLFVGDRDARPLSPARAAELMRGVEPEEISTLVAELNRRYEAGGCPYQIAAEGSGYRLVLRREYHPLRNRFYGRIRQARLSQAAVDVLAIVAYQQPLTSEEVSRLRGKPSGHVLAQLVRRGLLRIEREPTRRPAARYFTTERFLRLFGLEGLGDLPQSEDLEGQ
jgi:segregation and condensation protein B